MLRLGRTFSVRLAPRGAAACAVLAAATAAVALVSLGDGEVRIPLPDVVAALTGRAGGLERTVVVGWRLPRVLLAVLLGAALGMSGAVFQSYTRNPLGSPDVIGFGTGAHTGALVAMILLGGSYPQVAAGALAGGFGTAVLVYLAAGRGGVRGARLIISGIAIAAMLAGLNTWLMTAAKMEVAMAAAAWGAGTLNGVGWEQARPAIAVLALLLPAAALLSRPMRQLELGRDTATALGLRTTATETAMITIGVALTATATAAAGPVAFIALAAPQIGRRLARSAGTALAPAAFTGAFLLVTADWLARTLFAPAQLPVGVLTVVLGGLYLLWLLIRQARSPGA
ncbi:MULTISPECIES: FecCD family ABC transporter permease [Actinomadura]|uniref:FecCD family ABC transporter permease n=1 Tax=Actinomadura yumaensis TaxID=111807 RepID=A0ABW2CLY3_9ACTN|nr:iron chelate uptake ABC transporter family permease subunit [Actinomadura sp. J1-007]